MANAKDSRIALQMFGFMSGALVMRHDHHRGRDFVDEAFELRHSMFAEFTPRLGTVTSSGSTTVSTTSIFRRYSKVRNPQLKRYTLGFAQLLEASP